ncbi:phenoloxidase-activating factor 2 [Bombyx mori]|uniref:Phenoloxidase-activating factor 2 n=1 Tax=Bombyx mori TaxID=7091 RepID=A0A8R2M6P2_BOMMO|nr:phenoloxidase-activating factor 2 [Bombyx mori]
MKMNFVIVLLAAAIAATAAQEQPSEALNNTILSIFNSAPSTLQPTEGTSSPASTIDLSVFFTTAPTTTAASTEPVECTTFYGQKGVCVSFFLCTSKNNTFDLGINSLTDNRICATYTDVCCVFPDQANGTAVVPEPGAQQEPPGQGCGWRNPDGIALETAYQSEEGFSKFGEIPWMVVILRTELRFPDDPESQKLYVYIGGGSLIHPSVVLTAGHMLNESVPLTARVGDWDARNIDEVFTHQDRNVKSFIIHEQFNRRKFLYDAALLFLESPVDLTPNVGVACLPPPMDSPAAKTKCLATGWGKDKFGKEGRHRGIMKKIEVPVVENQVCQRELRKTRLGRLFQLHESFMCAGGQRGRDPCTGDGGSPLVCPIPNQTNRYWQSGIVSWGIGCGEQGTPGVYVDVSKIRAWIDEKVAENGFDTKAYQPKI